MNRPPRQARQVACVICIDVEPDQRTPSPRGPVSWDGFEAMTARLAEARRTLTQASGHTAAFTWFVRVDPQVEAVCGSADWAARHYAGQFARLLEEGDDLGLHVHATRFDEQHAVWTIDHADPDWIAQCVRSSYQVFRRCFERNPAAFRFGDGWMTDRTLTLIEDEGTPIDMTLRPGWRPPDRLPTNERSLGPIVDYASVPPYPYRPSTDDFRRPAAGASRRIWMVPETVGPHPARLERGWLREALLSLLGRAPGRAAGESALVPLDLGLPGPAFATTLSLYLRECPSPLVVVVARSNVASVPELATNLVVNLGSLAARSTRHGLVFETATAALERWRRDWPARLSVAS